MLFPNFMDYMMPKVLSFPDTIYHGWWMAAIFENGPVSYTHLDVYKRQVTYGADCY